MHVAAWSISCLLPRGFCWAQLLCLGYLKEYLVFGGGGSGVQIDDYRDKRSGDMVTQPGASIRPPWKVALNLQVLEAQRQK